MKTKRIRGSLVLVACLALLGCGLETSEDRAAIEAPGPDGEPDAGALEDPGDDDDLDELFEELICELEPSPYEEAIANAEEACLKFTVSCTAEAVGLGADILGQVLPVSCGLEFPVGATIATVIGWDPNKDLFENLAAGLAGDLLCQLTECFGPTDPYTIAAKALCGCRSLERAISRCTELYEACDDAEAAIPIVDEDGEIISPDHLCPIHPPTVASCENGQPRDTDSLVVDCALAVDRRRDEIENQGYGNCVSQCVNASRRDSCDPPGDVDEESAPPS